jgi:hypothetical protein
MKTTFGSRLELVLGVGSASDSPAPVGSLPNGIAVTDVVKWTRLLEPTVVPVLSGESSGGTGKSPVLPRNDFSNTRQSLARPALLLSFALFVFAVAAHADDWPMFGRDKTRNPVSPEMNHKLFLWTAPLKKD